MDILVNPGSGPVGKSDESKAISNMEAFLHDVDRRLPRATPEFFAIQAHRDPTANEGYGRFAFLITSSVADPIPVSMPGIELDKIRYTGAPDQNIFDFPRLYVDGSSWLWVYAVNTVVNMLTDGE